MTSDLQKSLAAKIAGLPRSTPATRRAVYDEARAALQAEVRAAAPFMPVQTVVAKRRDLEDAIIAVERAAAQSDPPHVDPEDVEPPPKHESPPAEPVPPDEPPPGHAIATGKLKDETTSALLQKPSGRKPDSPPSSHADGQVADALPAWEPAGPESREFAPEHDRKRERRRFLSTSTFVALPSALVGAAAATIVLATFALNPFQRPAQEPSPTKALEPRATVEPATIPTGASAGVELIRDAGFSAAAQNAIKEGDALLARQDLGAAIAAFNDAIRLDPTRTAAYGRRAFAHWRSGDANAAIRDYDAALQLEPGNLAYRLSRAVALNRIGEYQRAIADLDRVIHVEPENFDALTSRCLSHLLFDHLSQALFDCDEALKLRPQDLNTLDNRGLIFLRLGRLDRAVSDFTAALQLDPKRASSLYGRGLAKIGRGDRAGGNEDVAAARMLNPEIQTTFARYGIR